MVGFPGFRGLLQGADRAWNSKGFEAKAESRNTW